MTIRDALREVANEIGIRDAEVFLADVLHVDRAWLFAHPEDQTSEEQWVLLQQMAGRRSSGEPLQYILERQEFFGLSLRVTPDVLIPRPETEILVEAVLDHAGSTPTQKLRIVDVGTGSGAIAIALSSRLRQCQIVATDVSENALQVALGNAKSLGVAERITFQRRDLLAGIPSATLDVVVSNPPYIAQGDATGMQREVVEHEPHTALFAGQDGLDIYRRLIPQARQVLRKDGLLAMEFGWGQRLSLERLLEGWNDIAFLDDYAGIPRVVLARNAR